MTTTVFTSTGTWAHPPVAPTPVHPKGPVGFVAPKPKPAVHKPTIYVVRFS